MRHRPIVSAYYPVSLAPAAGEIVQPPEGGFGRDTPV
jgi:hypothetical protein